MSRDLLSYFEKLALNVTEKDHAFIYNMLVFRFFWPHKTSFIGLMRQELQHIALSQADWTTAEQDDELLYEQVVQPQFFSDAASILLDSMTKKVETNNLSDSWIYNALIVMTRCLCQLDFQQLHELGTRNIVFTSRYEKEDKVHFEIAVLQVIVRKPSSLQNILPKKQASVIDLSAYYKKIIE